MAAIQLKRRVVPKKSQFFLQRGRERRLKASQWKEVLNFDIRESNLHEYGVLRHSMAADPRERAEMNALLEATSLGLRQTSGLQESSPRGRVASDFLGSIFRCRRGLDPAGSGLASSPLDPLVHSKAVESSDSNPARIRWIHWIRKSSNAVNPTNPTSTSYVHVAAENSGW